MPEKLVNSDAVLVNGRQYGVDVAYDSRSRNSSSRRKQHGRDEVTGRRISRGRQVAERLVARISTAAASATAWRHPAGSTSESASATDDSGCSSTGRRTRSTVESPDQATSDACSVSTTAMSSSPVDWLDVDRMAIHRVPGAVGISNHHNTCFINAVVQCLSNTPAFVIHALDPAIQTHYHDHISSSSSQKGQPIRSQLTKDGELGKELSRLLRAMWNGRSSADSSAAFHRAVRRLACGWYAGEEQNDANEFAAWMLNRLRDEQFGDSDVDDCPRHPAVSSVRQTVR